MKKIIITAALCLTSALAWAQHTVTDKWGNQVPAPVFDADGAAAFNLARRPEHRDAQGSHKALGKPSDSYLTHKGTPRILTVLVNFADTAMIANQPKKAFDQFFNHEGTPEDLGNGNYRNLGSVSQYFSSMSSGQFKPQFDVYGPVTVPQTRAYYGNSSNVSSTGEKPEELVRDALSLLVDSIADATVYDNDGDGRIDCVYIIYAGCGQNYGGDSTSVWAKTGTVSGTFKGMSLNRYSMAGELTPLHVSNTSTNWMIAGIGVTCHELSHAMGLPDIYPTVSKAYVNNQEMEYWDLMDGGEYVYNGFRPAAYTAWEKMQMEWPVEIQTLATSQNGVEMSQTTEQGGVVYKIQNNDEPAEYFLLENIQKTGWNRSMPGHGLLVYHVNEVGNNVINSGTRLNNEPGKPGMAVVPADGTCLSSYLVSKMQPYLENLAGDPFPGTSNVTALNDNTGLPNFCWYAGNNEQSAINNKYHKVDKALVNIAESNGVISFDFIHNYATGIHETVNDSPQSADAMVYTINGQRVGTSIQRLQPGIYVRNGKKIVVK